MYTIDMFGGYEYAESDLAYSTGEVILVRIYTIEPNQLRWESPIMPPDDFLNELRIHKPVLME